MKKENEIKRCLICNRQAVKKRMLIDTMVYDCKKCRRSHWEDLKKAILYKHYRRAKYGVEIA